MGEKRGPYMIPRGKPMNTNPLQPIMHLIVLSLTLHGFFLVSHPVGSILVINCLSQSTTFVDNQGEAFHR
jgi:hypothetical protein